MADQAQPSKDAPRDRAGHFRITILGSGGSTGIPSIHFGWGKCDPNNPRNRRRRASIMVEWCPGPAPSTPPPQNQTIGTRTPAETRLVVDTGPDFREQILDTGIRHLDGILYTHEHADHIHGIDDVRDVNRAMGRPVEMWMDARTESHVVQRFSYIFSPQDPNAVGFYKPQAALRRITVGETIHIGDMPGILPINQNHGWSDSLGFRFGRSFAYSTDAVVLDDTAFQALEGVDLWVVDCVTRNTHATHAHLDLTLEWIERVKPRRAILTHMSTQLDHQFLCDHTPDHVEPAYDGQVLVVDEPP